jgi:hypothetical protein
MEPEWAAVALTELEKGRSQEPQRLSGRTVLEQENELRRLVTPSAAPIVDWYDWLGTLAASAAPRELVTLARDRSEQWSATRLLEEPDVSDLTLDVLTASPRSAEVFREVRPLLVPAVFAASAARPDLVPTASEFLRVVGDGLVGDERLGYGDLDDLASIAEFVVGAGLTAEEYRAFVLGVLQSGWERASSVKAVGWLADMVELLIDSPCPDEESRLAFTSAMVTALTRFRSQIPPEHWDRAEEVFDSFGRRAEIADLRPEFAEGDAALQEWGRLEGRRIFVYTLIEQAGDRARHYVASVAPAAVVDVWSSSVSDDRMLHAVRAASLVVIATRAAKHAATLAIERAVPAGVPVTYPTGKGWSSIVSSIRDALPQLADP